MTSVADQRVNLTRHMDWEHGVSPGPLWHYSLADLMNLHASKHSDAGSVEHRAHLARALKGETANINSTQEES